MLTESFEQGTNENSRAPVDEGAEETVSIELTADPTTADNCHLSLRVLH